MTEDRPTALGEPVYDLKLDGHRFPLTVGTEYSVRNLKDTGDVRARFLYARLTPKGWEVTGWTGKKIATVRGESVHTIHRTRKIPPSPDTMRPPARRRGR